MPNIVHGVAGGSPVYISAAMTHVVCDNSTSNMELVLPRLADGADREIMVCKKSTAFAVTVVASGNDRVNGKEREELKSKKSDAWFLLKHTASQWVTTPAPLPLT
jgi:hypothetical protein